MSELLHKHSDKSLHLPERVVRGQSHRLSPSLLGRFGWQAIVRATLEPTRHLKKNVYISFIRVTRSSYHKDVKSKTNGLHETILLSCHCQVCAMFSNPNVGKPESHQSDLWLGSGKTPKKYYLHPLKKEEEKRWYFTSSDL